MMVGHTPYIVLLVFSSLFSLGLLAYTMVHRKSSGTMPLMFVILLGFLCAVSYLGEMTTAMSQWKLFWLNVRQAASHLLPLSVLALSIRVSGNDSWNNKKLLLLLSVVPAVYGALTFTNEFHGLAYSGVVVQTADQISFMRVERTPLAWFAIGYSYVLILCSLFVLLFSYIRSPYPFRRQYLVFGISVLLPAISMMAEVARVNPLAPFVSTPINMLIGGIGLSIGLFKYHLLKIWPIARYRVFEHIRHAIMITDPGGRLVDINPEAIRILKQYLRFSDSGSWLGHYLPPLIASWPEWQKAYSRKSSHQLEISLADETYYEVNIEPLTNRHGQTIGHLTFMYDISNRKQIEKELHVQATTDYLTGVLNRRYFMEFARQEFLLSVRYQRPFSLLMIDLDHFKRINDDHGHYVGDLVLKRFARQCRTCLRETDIFARMGGEEFAVALPETTLEGAVAVAEKIRQLIENESMEFEGKRISFTISIGIASRTNMDASFDTMLLRADTVLYKAKQHRNCVYTQ